jgi:hypothetical protein
MNDSSGLSNLGRPVDPNYPSNLFIIVASVGSFLGFGISSYISGGKVLSSLGFAAGSFFSVFLAWALARELDPDYHLTAVLVVGGQVAAIVFNGVPSLLLPFWALFSFRVLNRTTGLKAGPIDNLLSAGLGIWLGYSLSWVVTAVGAVIFLADGVMDRPNRAQLIPGGVMAAAAGYFFYRAPTIWIGFSGFPIKLAIVLVISVLFFLVIYDSRKISSTGDLTGEILSTARVQFTQFVALLVALLIPLWNGVVGFHQSITFWAVLGSAVIIHLLDLTGLKMDRLWSS